MVGESTPAAVPSLSNLRWLWGSTPDPDPYVFVLCDLNLGGGEGIHSGSNSGPIFVSPELFAYIDIMLSLCYL